MSKPVLLYSGGIDCFLAHWKINLEDPILVYYNIRTRYAMAEMKFLQEKKVNVLVDNTFSFGDIEEDTAFVPNRNLHLAMHAACKYSPKVYIGGTASDRVSDNNKDIMNLLSCITNKSVDRGEEIVITSPFWDTHKCELAQQYCEDFSPESLERSTFSCYTPTKEDKECLNCVACFRKSVILNSIGIFRNTRNRTIVKKYWMEFKDDEDAEVNPRKKTTLEYVKRIL